MPTKQEEQEFRRLFTLFTGCTLNPPALATEEEWAVAIHDATGSAYIGAMDKRRVAAGKPPLTSSHADFSKLPRGYPGGAGK